MITIRRTSARRPTPAAPRPWKIPTLAENDPGHEAYALLGPAWRSSTACPVETGHCFDVLRTPQPTAGPALDQFWACGAVTADGDCWNFFVPPRSGGLPWPPWVTYLSGPVVQIPPRAARDDSLSLRWITRGYPTGRLLTTPSALFHILTALAPPSPEPQPSL